VDLGLSSPCPEGPWFRADAHPRQVALPWEAAVDVVEAPDVGYGKGQAQISMHSMASLK
jgi:hypothetical protein